MTKHTTNGKSVQVVEGKWIKEHPLTVEAILATLTPEQMVEMRKVLGVRTAKKAGPGEFEQAVIGLCDKVQSVLAEEHIPSAFCIELGRDVNGYYFCHTARIRHKYGPRNPRKEESLHPEQIAAAQAAISE